MIALEVLFFINLFTFILSLVKYVNGDEKSMALGILSFIFQIFLITWIWIITNPWKLRYLLGTILAFIILASILMKINFMLSMVIINPLFFAVAFGLLYKYGIKKVLFGKRSYKNIIILCLLCAFFSYFVLYPDALIVDPKYSRAIINNIPLIFITLFTIFMIKYKRKEFIRGNIKNILYMN